MLAGGNIDLGNSKGVISSANLQDSRLSSAGATVLTGAGFGRNADGTLRDPAYDAFESTYIAPGGKGNTSDYQAALIAYMKQLFPDQIFSDADQAYAASASWIGRCSCRSSTTFCPMSSTPPVSTTPSRARPTIGLSGDSEHCSRRKDAGGTLLPTRGHQHVLQQFKTGRR